MPDPKETPVTTPQTTPPDPAPATPAPDAPPATPPAEGTPPATPPTDKPAATPSPAEEEVENLLAGGDDDTPPTEQPDGAEPPDEAKITEFIDSIKVDIGKKPDGTPIEINKEALKAIAPAAIKHGLSSDAISEIVQNYANFEMAQAQEAMKKDRELVSTITKTTKEKLGKDLPRFISEAKVGGPAFFGKELWAQIANVPALMNDVRFIEACAAHGRSIQTDRGPGGKPSGDGKPKDFAESWIGSSNRK